MKIILWAHQKIRRISTTWWTLVKVVIVYHQSHFFGKNMFKWCWILYSSIFRTTFMIFSQAIWNSKYSEQEVESPGLTGFFSAIDRIFFKILIWFSVCLAPIASKNLSATCLSVTCFLAVYFHQILPFNKKKAERRIWKRFSISKEVLG